MGPLYKAATHTILNCFHWCCDQLDARPEVSCLSLHAAGSTTLPMSLKGKIINMWVCRFRNQTISIICVTVSMEEPYVLSMVFSSILCVYIKVYVVRLQSHLTLSIDASTNLTWQLIVLFGNMSVTWQYKMIISKPWLLRYKAGEKVHQAATLDPKRVT